MAGVSSERLLGARLRSAALAVAVVSTAAVLLVPGVPFAHRDRTLHVALGTAIGSIALVAALLTYGRFQRHRQWRELVQCAAFLTFGAANLLYAVVPTVARDPDAAAYDTWAVLLARTAAALLLAVGALLGPGSAGHASDLGRRAGALVPLAVLALLGAIAAAVRFWPGGTPLSAGPAPDAPFDPYAALEQPLIAGVMLAGAGAYTAAAWGFARQERTGGGDVATWLSAAAILGATGRLHGALHPSLSSGVVSSDDLLRVGFFGLVLVAVVREIRRDAREVARAAVLDERRRLARDLHDGVAQELAFIRREAEALQATTPSPRTRLLASAARRALDESRRATGALTAPDAPPLPQLLVQMATEVGARTGHQVELTVDSTVAVDADTREELLRIAREAVHNAIDHGAATHLALELRDGDPLVLRVVDDGVGFDVDAPPRSGGFGLVSMRERAAALGGAFHLRSIPGGGTVVEVRLPRDDRR